MAVAGTVRVDPAFYGPGYDMEAIIESASAATAQATANSVVREARALAPISAPRVYIDAKGRKRYGKWVDADGHEHPGYLKSSIKAKKVSEGVWVVEVEAYYGVYVEYGTRYMHAQPYFRPAISIVRRQVQRTWRSKVLEEKKKP